MQKRKLQEAISLHHDFLGVGQNKKIQERIINNFRSFNRSTYLHQPSPQFASAAMPPSMHQLPSYPSQHPYNYTQGVNGSINDNTTIDLTTGIPSTKVKIIPNFLSMLNSLDDNNEEERERKKSKLMKVCVNHTRSALKKNLPI